HVVSRAVVERAPERGCLIADVHLPLLRAGARSRAIACVERWFDIGDLSSYLAANAAHAFVATDARIEPGIAVDRCALGAMSRVVGAGALREVVVWPGRTARAPLERAIVVDGDEIVRA